MFIQFNLSGISDNFFIIHKRKIIYLRENKPSFIHSLKTWQPNFCFIVILLAFNKITKVAFRKVIFFITNIKEQEQQEEKRGNNENCRFFWNGRCKYGLQTPRSAKSSGSLG